MYSSSVLPVATPQCAGVPGTHRPKHMRAAAQNLGTVVATVGRSINCTARAPVQVSLKQARSIVMEAVVYPPYLPSDNDTDGRTVSKVNAASFYPHGIKSMSKGTTIVDAMRRLGDSFQEVPLIGSSPYVKPASVLYTFDGKPKRWDIVEALPSVGIVLYHSELKSFLLVRQFRPPVYMSRFREALAAGLPPPCKSAGFTYELCAGLVDKSKTLRQIASEEIMEEVGYDVPPEALQELGNSVASAGTSGALHHLYLAVVDESMRASGAGGGLQETGECIEVLALPVEHALEWAIDPSLAKSPGALFGVTWGVHQIQMGKLAGNKDKTPDNPMLTQELTLREVLPS